MYEPTSIRIHTFIKISSVVTEVSGKIWTEKNLLQMGGHHKGNGPGIAGDITLTTHPFQEMRLAVFWALNHIQRTWHCSWNWPGSHNWTVRKHSTDTTNQPVPCTYQKYRVKNPWGTFTNWADQEMWRQWGTLQVLGSDIGRFLNAMNLRLACVGTESNSPLILYWVYVQSGWRPECVTSVLFGQPFGSVKLFRKTKLKNCVWKKNWGKY